MKKLKAVLSEYASAPKLGDIAQPLEKSTAPLADDVRKISVQNSVYFRICFTLLVLLFVGAALLVVFSLNDPSRVKAVLTASGVSFFGIVGQMLKLWKEKVASDLTLTLVTNLSAREIKPTLEILLRGLR